MAIPDFDVDSILQQLTLPEKISLVSGRDFWHTTSVPRLKIPAIRLSDGATGVRGIKFFNGTPAACLPCGTALGATWDPELIEKGGALQAREGILKGASVVLGPTTNIQRSPLGGRGFESFSEDPFLAGTLAAATIKGLQSNGVAASLKHFACNDQEDHRMSVNAIVTERALREIYLMPFQVVQQIYPPWTYMASYNKVNGVHSTENIHLLKEVLREEWGFDGLVMSDWFATYSADKAILAGLDLEMPGPSYARGAALRHSILPGKVKEYELDACVRQVLRLIKRVLPLGIEEDAEERTDSNPDTSKLLRSIAAESIVLLKNENAVLPFCPDKFTAVIGPNADFAAFSGGGSTMMTPYYTVSPLEGIMSECKQVGYSLGCGGWNKLPALSRLTKTKSGLQGLTMAVHLEPSTREKRELLEVIHVSDSVMDFCDYKHKSMGDDYLFYADFRGTLIPEESANYQFSCSVLGTARVFVDDQLLIDNATNQVRGDTFFATGTREEFNTIFLEKGRAYEIYVDFGSIATYTLEVASTAPFGGGGLRLGCTRVFDPQGEIQKAVALAKAAEQVVLCIGLNGEWESEGFDRDNMDLPGYTDELVRAVAQVNPNTAVIVQSGTPVTMPWVDQVPAILQAWYGGNETGNGIADVIFGKKNPAAKLPLSFPSRLEDNPSFINFGNQGGRVLYGEDVFVGYRYYEKSKTPVAFPFGHGLSYTSFHFETLQVKNDGESFLISVDVANTGVADGAQVIQVYVAHIDPLIPRPLKELKGFKKVFIPVGESRVVDIRVSVRHATSFWDEDRNMWLSAKGDYQLLVGDSSANTPLCHQVTVEENSWWKGLCN
ncbi:beta-glucosidase precursor, putative [Talaromyces stipitatus ATCC 10500]|uniref:beta-glucosidase n=1 Tax=Talaromyces stipitatus (strain ATCC 10500 / CBS 375.48 / QM 6759 / NRRL 1006) TaxID=441959 RepID=B8MF24_TALSN|nr:beta-glucosidase precursor, putative [Talaromyces stipitatus ATCC 10500]EED16123.1 beta-glucosidase precursor, putative [Talaromyces stipitatus ATCC 10500]